MQKFMSAHATPFSDPAMEQEAAGDEAAFSVDSTLAVGMKGDASLTLATDSLIVLDEDFDDAEGEKCCGILPSGMLLLFQRLWRAMARLFAPRGEKTAWDTEHQADSPLLGTSNTCSIPFYNILWASISNNQITIDYCASISKSVVRPQTIQYPLSSTPEFATIWLRKLLDRSYLQSQKRKRALVLVNPHAGKGSATKYWARDISPIFKAARISVEVLTTSHQGEAVGIVESMDIEKFDMVVSCSGDGLPHEVFNGLGKRKDARRALGKVAVVQMPCGSGNAMSCNLTGSASPSLAALATVKGVVAPLDLISITQGERRTLSFLSQSVGIVAESDLATEHIRWMGQARFTYGFLIRLLRKRVYPCDLAVKVEIEGKENIKEHWAREAASTSATDRHQSLDDASASTSTIDNSGEGLPPLKYGTINDKLPSDWTVSRLPTLGNFYCGNMSYMAADANFFPASLPNDGMMDLVNIDGKIARTAALDLMLSVEKGSFFDKEKVAYRKVAGYRITPRDQDEGYISIDGERVPFEAFQAEVHRGLGTTLARRVHRYEAAGPRGEQ